MPGTFSLPLPVNKPNMYHGTCVTHVPWCMPGSLTSGFFWSWWRGKRSWHSRCRRSSSTQEQRYSPPLGHNHYKFHMTNLISIRAGHLESHSHHLYDKITIYVSIWPAAITRIMDQSRAHRSQCVCVSSWRTIHSIILQIIAPSIWQITCCDTF